MYLLLIDQNLISSPDLKQMIEQTSADIDIVNCFSEETLLKIAGKIEPDFVIIDFDLLEGDPAALFDSLRIKSKNAHVLALINPDYYEKLFEAIESGGIDDYMVKPIQKDDFFARVKIAATKKKRPTMGDRELFGTGDQKTGAPEDLEEARETFDETAGFAEKKQVFTPRQDVGGSDRPDLGLDEQEQAESVYETFSESELFWKAPASEQDDPKSGPVEGGEKPGDENRIFDELDLFSDKPEERKPDSDFEVITPGEKDWKPEQEPGEQEVDHEIEDSGLDLFEDTGKTGRDYTPADQSIPEKDEEDLLKLFEDVDNIFDAREDSPEITGFEQKRDSTGDRDPLEDQDGAGTEPGPDVVRPADEFLGHTGSRDVQQHAAPLAEDKQFFDDLFDDLPEPVPRRKDTTPEAEDFAAEEVDSPDFEENFDEDNGASPSARPPLSQEEIRRKSALPGNSADEFLFGEDKSDNRDQDATGFEETESGREDDPADYFDEENWDEQHRSRKQKRPGGKFKGFFSIFGNVLFVLLLLVMAGLSFFLIQSRIAGGVPQVAGYQIYIVLSGSMSPEFDTGSLAFVREVEPEELVTGDIITYRSPADPDSLTTHRIVEVQREEDLRFITRGDANNVNDPNPVLAENVVGIVTGTMPYAGYLLNFVQTPQGLVLLIFVPGVLIIIFELNKIVKYLGSGDNGKKHSKGNNYVSPAKDEG